MNKLKKFKNQFLIVRHGEAQNNVDKVISCKIDTQKLHGLTDLGKKQVEDEAEKYSDFDVIFSSPARRTMETAEIFCKTSSLHVIDDSRLQEFDVGDFDGKAVSDCKLFLNKNRDPNFQVDNGESLQDVLDRMINFVLEIDKKYNNKKILIVTHGTPLEVLLDWSQNKKLTKRDERLPNAKVYKLDFA